jgi:hypothetical protein
VKQARQTIEGYKSAFMIKYRASGREITSVGNSSHEWNQD